MLGVFPASASFNNALCLFPEVHSEKLGLWADALHGSTRLIFFLQYIHPYIYNK